MILKYLNESIGISEDLIGDGIELLASNEFNKIYKITALSGFSVINDSIANDFGFTQANWDRYMTGDNAQIAYIITDLDDEPKGMLLSSNTADSVVLYNGLELYINASFEAMDHTSDYESCHLNPPLYAIPNILQSADYHVNEEYPGQLLNQNGKLIMLSSEFGFVPEAIEGNVLTISSEATSIGDWAFQLLGEDIPFEIEKIVLPDSITEVSSHAFENMPRNIQLCWTGFDLPEFLQHVDLDTEVVVAYGKSDEEIRQHAEQVQRAEQERIAAEQEAERQRIAQENQRVAQEIIDNISDMPEIAYNANCRDAMEIIKRKIENATEDQKALINNLSDFEAMVNRYNELKAEANHARAELRANSDKIVVGPLVFVIKNNQACLTYCKPRIPENSEIRIPETVEVNGQIYPVTRIEAGVFEDFGYKISRIYIPAKIIFIGSRAFADCNARRVFEGSQSKIKFAKDWR